MWGLGLGVYCVRWGPGFAQGLSLIREFFKVSTAFCGSLWACLRFSSILRTPLDLNLIPCIRSHDRMAFCNYPK